jgi:putative membrane protein
VRLLVRLVLAVIANAVSLLIAAALLDGVRVEASGFALAVVIFSLASVVLTPIVAWIVIRRARALLGVVALISTFVVLLVTDLLSSGFSVDGTLDWILAVVVVWIAEVAYELSAVPLQRRLLGGRRRGNGPGSR